MAIRKVKLPDNSVQDIYDARIPGVDSTPTSGSSNIITSGGVYTAIDGIAYPFIAVQGTTTVAQIKTALDAGRILIAKDSNNNYYSFSDYTETTILSRTTYSAYFERIENNANELQVICFKAVGTGATSCTITTKSVADISGSLLQEFNASQLNFPASNPVPMSNPPLAELSYNITDGTLQLEKPSGNSTETKTLAYTDQIIPDLFVATYGTTTWAELAAAYSDGKNIVLRYDHRIIPLDFLDEESNYAIFCYVSMDEDYVHGYKCTPSGWASSGYFSRSFSSIVSQVVYDISTTHDLPWGMASTAEIDSLFTSSSGGGLSS